MEPWDGPASIPFDGNVIGRYWIEMVASFSIHLNQSGFVIMSSEMGIR
jgi:hypothetical protein